MTQTSWQAEKWQVDKIANWGNVTLTDLIKKWVKVNKIQVKNTNLICGGRVDETASWQNVKLTKSQVYKMVKSTQ